MEFSKQQQYFLDTALSGKNIFLTGKAGTGKSLIVREAIAQLRKQKKNVVAIAPTGIAANNIDGQTIHSMFSINPYGVAGYETCNFLKSQKRRLLNAIDTIVIDEVSMLRPDVLDAIHWTLKKNGCDGLDKRQVIFVGDLAQLPSPINDNTRSVMFRTYDGVTFQYALIYPKLEVATIELDEVHRQTNDEFIANLNIIREGGRSEYFRQFLHTEPKGVILAPYNTTVQKYNEEGLKAQKGEEYVFHASVTGNAKADEFNLENELRVKNGCKIMYLVNSQNNPLRNGTLGIFVSHAGCHYIKVDGVEYALDQVSLTKKEYVYNRDTDSLELDEIGSITQYPFRLAYALSIHKSQGLTFEEVTLDLSRPCFSPGQMYVALSRVKSPEGLRIIVNRGGYMLPTEVDTKKEIA